MDFGLGDKIVDEEERTKMLEWHGLLTVVRQWPTQGSQDSHYDVNSEGDPN